MVCKYMNDEFCVNDQCPKRADYCPVPDDPEMCRYAELKEEMYKLTLKGCALAAMMHAEISAPRDKLDVFWAEFERLAIREGYLCKEDETDGCNGTDDR